MAKRPYKREQPDYASRKYEAQIDWNVDEDYIEDWEFGIDWHAALKVVRVKSRFIDYAVTVKRSYEQRYGISCCKIWPCSDGIFDSKPLYDYPLSHTFEEMCEVLYIFLNPEDVQDTLISLSDGINVPFRTIKFALEKKNHE